MSTIRTCLRKALTSVAVGGALLATATVATAQEAENPVLARVNGVDVVQSDLIPLQQQFGQQLAQLPPSEQLRILLDVFIDIQLMASAAEEQGIDEDPVVARRLENTRNGVLRAEYLRVNVFDTITEEVVQAEFDRQMADFVPDDEIRARHILVATEEEALGIIGELDGGADFATIAQERSTDTGSGRNGGDLGFFGRGAMVPPFEEAAFALEPGSYTAQPVESRFGFHIILLEETRKEAAPTFASRAQDIQGELVRTKVDELSSALRAAATVELVGPDGEVVPQE